MRSLAVVAVTVICLVAAPARAVETWRADAAAQDGAGGSSDWSSRRTLSFKLRFHLPVVSELILGNFAPMSLGGISLAAE